MKQFRNRFLIALLTFIFGVSAFAGWVLLRRAKRPQSVSPNVSDTIPKPQLQWTELTPLLQSHNLISSHPSNNHEVPDIEEADAQLFAPLAGETIFLQAQSPTKDSEELKPRYWLRVEDYPSAELAQKRAREYISDGSYERMAQTYGHDADSFIMSKLSLRIWAIARGR